MPTYLQVENGEVRGYVSGSKLVASDTLVEATPEMLAEFRALEAALVEDGRSARIQYAAGVLSLPADARLYLAIESDKTQVAAGGKDIATITVSRLTSGGAVDTRVTESRIIALSDGRYWRLDFVAGVATKLFAPMVGGRYAITSTSDYKVRDALVIIAYE